MSKKDIVKTQTVDETTESPKEVIKKRLTIKDIPLDTIVEVRNGFYGSLEYKDKRTGFSVVWNEFGSPQYMTLEELLTLKNTQIAFIEKNWIILTGENAENAMNFLQVEKYYQHVPDLDNFDDMFKFSPKQIIEKISPMAEGIKISIAQRAVELIKNKTLDSMSKIEALEKALNMELIER
jgi:hypothetical protein